MKAFRILAALMMAVVCVGLSSCSKDDDSSTHIDNSLDINLLYGTWIRESKGYNGDSEKEILVFNSNGTWNRTQVVNGNKGREEGHTFTYYKDTRVLALKDDETDNEPAGYTIIELTNNTFIWLDDENLFTYKRQK
ncbi:hypothetical protein ACIXUF_18970 [Bacteroides fragilis]|nr:hypothetical protein [Bacteroides fragilis]